MHIIYCVRQQSATLGDLFVTGLASLLMSYLEQFPQ